MIDVHCHLEYIENSEKIILESRKRGMSGIISSVTEPKKIGNVLNLKEKYPKFLFLSFGFHPNSVKDYEEKEILEYMKLIEKEKEKFVAIGEIGLDYFYRPSEEEKNFTKKVFKNFLDLSEKINLPVIIHCREAFTDLFEILREKRIKKVCLHCFSGSEGDLKEAIKRDYFISFATNICYTKKHPRLAEKTPLERMLLETDSPWLDPDSPKTLTNRPWKIEQSAKIISQIKKISPKEVLEITTKNAIRFFNLSF